MDYLTEQRRKLTAVMRAQHRLQQRMDTLDWERDVLKPALERLERKVLNNEQVEIKALPAGDDVLAE